MKSEITIQDKTFIPYITHDEIQFMVQNLAKIVNTWYKGKDLVIIGILNGSFMFLSDLVKEISQDINVTICFMKVSSYGGETKSSGEIKNIMNLETNIEDKHVLIIEDILDTGETIKYLKKNLKKNNPLTLGALALLSKKHALEDDIAYGKFIPDYFVIGYGMDYKGVARNFKHIYRLKT